MLHTHIKRDGPWENLRKFPPRPKTKPVDLFLSLIGLVLIATFAVVWRAASTPRPTAPMANPSLPISGNASASRLGGDLSSVEQNARTLATNNSPETFQMLIQSLKQDEPLSKRSIVITVLKDASPLVTPELIQALNDNDQGVRAGAAQLLGLRGEYQAIVALTAATRDSDANVRWQAVKSLGALDAWQALPRLEQLGVNEPNPDVHQAAMTVTESFKREMAQAIGVLSPELRDVAVTTGDVPQIYAVTTSNLYASREATAWTLISRLPDAPLAIAIGADPNMIYLATVSAGLYRSLDGGATWEHIQFGLQTPTHLTVTAVAVDPQNSRLVYIALASSGAELGIKDSLGINVSNDGGATWEALADSPMDGITTRLVIDPQSHDELFGMEGNTPWRYALSVPVCNACAD